MRIFDGGANATTVSFVILFVILFVNCKRLTKHLLPSSVVYEDLNAYAKCQETSATKSEAVSLLTSNQDHCDGLLLGGLPRKSKSVAGGCVA